MVATPDAVELSIVVATDQAGPGLRRCVSALKPQLCVGKIEAIVVNGSAKVLDALSELDGMQILNLPLETSVPALWEAGIEAARGRIVALTIEQCVPQEDWAKQVLQAHSSEQAAIGGAVEPGSNLSVVDWAVYFCRYSRFMLPASAEILDDLAGDNASYKREALAGVQEARAEGFWETFVHEALRREGARLQYNPALVVSYAGGIPAPQFLWRRFHHGRYFAARRGRKMRIEERSARALVSPVVPFMLLGRIASRVWRQNRFRSRFFLCLPMIFAFLFAWALGEAVGYLFDGRVNPVSEKPRKVVDEAG